MNKPIFDGTASPHYQKLALDFMVQPLLILGNLDQHKPVI